MSKIKQTYLSKFALKLNLIVSVETYTSFTLRPVFSNPIIPLIRALLGVVSLSVIIMTVVAGMLASAAWDADPPVNGDQLKWSKDEPGYYWHVTATGMFISALISALLALSI